MNSATYTQLCVEGVEYVIEPTVVCDMVCIVKLLGLYSVSSPQSKWKCGWCKVTKSEIGDMNVEKWPFRDIKEMVDRRLAKSRSTRKDKAGDLEGQVVTESEM